MCVFYFYSTQTIQCLLNRHIDEPNSRTANWLAGLASGIAYYIYPDITIMSHCTWCVAKLVWAKYERCSAHLKAVNQLPLQQIGWVIGSGVLYAQRLYYPHVCSSFAVKSMSYSAGPHFEKFLLTFVNDYLGFGS